MKRINLFPDETKQNLLQSSTKNQRRSPTSHCGDLLVFTYPLHHCHTPLSLDVWKAVTEPRTVPVRQLPCNGGRGTLCPTRTRRRSFSTGRATTSSGAGLRRPERIWLQGQSPSMSCPQLTVPTPRPAIGYRRHRRATFSSTVHVCPSAKVLSTRALAKGEAIAPALSRCSASGQVASANARHRQRRPLYQSRSVASAPGRS
eukprot:g26230.t1